MNDKRLLLAVVLAGVILFGWNFLMSKTGLVKAPPGPVATATSANPESTAAASPQVASPLTSAVSARPATFTAAAPESLIPVETEHWSIVFSTKGARPANWVLKDFRRADHHPVDLVAEGGGMNSLRLRRRGAEEVEFADAPFRLVENKEQGAVRVLIFETRDSLAGTIRVHYEIPRDSLVARFGVEVASPQPDDKLVVEWRSWKMDTETNQHEDFQQARVASLLGQELEQTRLSEFKKHPEKKVSGNLRWSVLRSRYFATGFIFHENGPGEVVSSGNADKKWLGVHFESALLGKSDTGFNLYMGPVDYWKLDAAGHGLAGLVDADFWPMFRPIMAPITRTLIRFFTWTHTLVPNYGLVIIVLSVVLRLVLYPLSQSQVRSMQKMQQLQPVVEKIRKKYEKEPEKMNSEIFKIYREHKVNPVGGCLPVVLQMPVFIGLYAVFSSSIALRQAPFVGWINDLSAPDVLLTLGPVAGGMALHVLPLIMVATMVWQQKLTPMDPSQAAMAYIMPIVFLFIFYGMPSGLVLYWTVTNILTALQTMQTRAKTPALAVEA